MHLCGSEKSPGAPRKIAQLQLELSQKTSTARKGKKGQKTKCLRSNTEVKVNKSIEILGVIYEIIAPYITLPRPPGAEVDRP